MGTLWWAYFASAAVLRVVTPPFGKLRATEAKLEGEYRFAHSRIITNAEEIAFYGGEETEKKVVDSRYLALVKHTNRWAFFFFLSSFRLLSSSLRHPFCFAPSIFRTRIWFNVFEDMLIKYLWSTIGLLAQAFPVFYPEAAFLAAQTIKGKANDLAAVRTEQYITNKRMMMNLADAGGRIMYSYKDLTELAGFTARVHQMLTVFDDMKKENYEKVSATDLLFARD